MNGDISNESLDRAYRLLRVLRVRTEALREMERNKQRYSFTGYKVKRDRVKKTVKAMNTILCPMIRYSIKMND